MIAITRIGLLVAVAVNNFLKAVSAFDINFAVSLPNSHTVTQESVSLSRDCLKMLRGLGKCVVRMDPGVSNLKNICPNNIRLYHT